MLAARSTSCARSFDQSRVTNKTLVAGRPVVARRASTKFVVAAKAPPEVLQETRSIIAEQLGKETSEVAPDSKFVDLGADSLDTVEIMMALEEKFEIQLDEQGAEKIETVQQASDMIQKVIESK